MNRRRFTLSAMAASAAAMLPLPAFALSGGQATALVDKLVAAVNKVISSGKSEAAMIRDFEKIFRRYADLNIIARSALGADGRRASSAQIKNFTNAFAGYMSRKYGKRFREFIGGKIEVKSTKPIKGNYQIKTNAVLRGQAPFDVTFLVSDKSGSPKFYNMFIEGINLLLTERTEIGAMLDKRRGDIDAMIADLKKAG